ncbi:TPA: TIR domain-containing protein [Bacillus cereus]|nr:TIR domain-containing protein [Bacillus cereus]
MENKLHSNSRPPKIFISYAWTSEEYQEKVIKFAQRLRENGIDVVADFWDLNPGNSLFAFMESMVTDPTIDKVLVLCNKIYADKAAAYTGGVGTETQIIGPHIYNKVRQEKFIPVILEREELDMEYIPVHMSGLIYIDLDRRFEKGFEELLRLLYNKPLLRKPELGTAPSYIFEEKKTRFKVDGILSSMQDAIIHRPGRIASLCYDYKKALLEDLEAYRVLELSEPYDEQVYNLIQEMIPLRNNYIKFMELLCSDQTVFDTKMITDLFETLNIYSGSFGTTGPIEFEHFRYFIHELFLYTITILISRNMYDKLHEICKHRYFVKYNNYAELQDGSYGFFYFYLHSLIDTRNRRLQLNRTSVHADLIKEQSISSGYSWENLIEADCLLYCIKDIQRLLEKKQEYSKRWYPVTYAYFQFSDPILPILQRLKSREHFNEIKKLLGVESIEQLENVKKLSAEEYRSSVPSLNSLLPNELAIY